MLTRKHQTGGATYDQQYWKGDDAEVQRELRLCVKGSGEELYTELNGHRATWEQEDGEWILIVEHSGKEERYVIVAVDGRWRRSR